MSLGESRLLLAVILIITAASTLMPVAPATAAAAADTDALLDPSLSMPALSVPDLSAPAISMPALSAPSVPTLSVPTLSAPAISASFALLDTLAGPTPPRGDYLPNVAATLITQNEMRRVVDESGQARVTATVPLRRDLFWPDGTRLSAYDVVASYEAALARTHPLVDPYVTHVALQLLDRVEAVDHGTVRFWLKWMPGLGEWQYGLMLLPILRDGESPPGARPLVSQHGERIVLFMNGSAAITNPVTGYSYLSKGVGGEVESSFERHQPPAPDSAYTEYYVGFNVRRPQLMETDARRWIASVLAGEEAGPAPVPFTEPLRILVPFAPEEIGAVDDADDLDQVDEVEGLTRPGQFETLTLRRDAESMRRAHDAAARLRARGVPAEVEVVESPHGDRHLLDARAPDLDADLVVFGLRRGTWGPPHSLAALFEEVNAVYQWVRILGYSALQYDALLTKLIAARTEADAHEHAHAWRAFLAQEGVVTLFRP